MAMHKPNVKVKAPKQEPVPEDKPVTEVGPSPEDVANAPEVSIPIAAGPDFKDTVYVTSRGDKFWICNDCGAAIAIVDASEYQSIALSKLVLKHKEFHRNLKELALAVGFIDFSMPYTPSGQVNVQVYSASGLELDTSPPSGQTTEVSGGSYSRRDAGEVHNVARANFDLIPPAPFGSVEYSPEEPVFSPELKAKLREAILRENWGREMPSNPQKVKVITLEDGSTSQTAINGPVIDAGDLKPPDDWVEPKEPGEVLSPSQKDLLMELLQGSPEQISFRLQKLIEISKVSDRCFLEHKGIEERLKEAQIKIKELERTNAYLRTIYLQVRGQADGNNDGGTSGNKA